MTVLKKIWDFLLVIERAIMIIASIGVVLLIFISVIMRYLLESSFNGMEELIILVAFWIYFIGASYGSYEGSQITADILSVFIKNEKGKLTVALIRDVITTVILFAASYCAVELMIYTLEAGAVTSVLKIPMMVVYTPIIVGIFLMNFYTLAHAVNDAIKLFGRKKQEVEA